MKTIIVKQTGYYSIDKLLNIDKKFSVYKTNKNTIIVVFNINYDEIMMFYPKLDRLPYKIIEGKKIINGIKISKNEIENKLDINQIMTYEIFSMID